MLFKEKVFPVDEFGKIYKQERIGIREYDYEVISSSPDGDYDQIEQDTEAISEDSETAPITSAKMYIKYSVGAKKVSEISQTVANAVFDSETGEYIPEYVDFLINVQILEEYAYFRIPRKLEQVYRFISETDVVDFVKSKINQEEIAAIHNGVYRRIEYMKQNYIALRESEVNKILAQVETLIENISQNFSDANIEKIISVAESITKLPKETLANAKYSQTENIK
jgi:hypothetical protein